MSFAMVLAFLAIFAVKLRCVVQVSITDDVAKIPGQMARVSAFVSRRPSSVGPELQIRNLVNGGIERLVEGVLGSDSRRIEEVREDLPHLAA